MRRLLYEWFVRYNPFYFLSAMGVLAGVSLLSRELPSCDLTRQALLIGVVQGYELMLIAAAAFLLRRASQTRPAVLLGLLAGFFLFDGTMSAVRIGEAGEPALWLNAALAVLGTLKLMLLARTFGLRRVRGPMWMAAALIAYLSLAPQAIEAAGPGEGPRRALHLALCWPGALLLAWALRQDPRRWDSDAAEDEWGVLVLRRIATAAPLAMTAIFFLHVAAWSHAFATPLSPAHAAPFILVLGLRAAGALNLGAIGIGLSAAACLGCAAFPPPLAEWPAPPVAPAALACALVLFRANLALPACACAAAAIYFFGLEADSPAWLATPVGLLVVARLRRSPACLAASSVCVSLAAISTASISIAPHAGLLALVWWACWSWLIFPELRRWIPASAAVLVGTGGALLLARPDPELALWYLALLVVTLLLGHALRSAPLKWAGWAAVPLLLAGQRDIWLPQTGSGWGIFALAAGFASLFAGFAINLRVTPSERGYNPSK